jgi:hypothetical protein
MAIRMSLAAADNIDAYQSTHDAVRFFTTYVNP